MSEQVLVEQRPWQVSKRCARLRLLGTQLRNSLGVLRINHHKAWSCRIGEIDEDIIVRERADIIQVTFNGLQRIAIRAETISRTEILSVRAKNLLTFVGCDTLTDQND